MKKTLFLTYFLGILISPQMLHSKTPTKAKVSGTQTQKNVQEIPDMILGDPQAPVALVEFISLNCSHCAQFYEKVTPELLDNYVQSKHLKIVYKHFPIDLQSLQAMMLVTSLPANAQQDKFFQVLSSQKAWIYKDIQAVADICGINKDQCKKILQDEKLQDAVAAKRFNAEKKYDIPATPMFLIQYPGGEELMPSGISPADLKGKLDKHIETYKDQNVRND